MCSHRKTRRNDRTHYQPNQQSQKKFHTPGYYRSNRLDQAGKYIFLALGPAPWLVKKIATANVRSAAEHF
jgi:hypothetical protein